MSRRLLMLSFALVPALLAVLAVGGALFLRQGGFAPYRVPAGGPPAGAPAPQQVARGEYLAELGNCAGCHTARGGVPFAGGRAFPSDYGTIYSTNLTPDPRTGLGDWSAAEFRHAMRHGVSRRGVLYPAFPYAQFARLTDADLDALFAYLRSLPPSVREATPNRLEFPANWRPALIGWRMLLYRPEPPAAGDDGTPAQRGRYLVEGLGHCAMCHGTYGPMSSPPDAGDLAGGRIPGLGWYAPPLDAWQLKRYSADELAAYLRTGTSPHGSAYGPMAEVIFQSLRHLTAEDAAAMAAYLKSVPARPGPEAALAPTVAMHAGTQEGEALYRRHCESCHAPDGRGTDKGPPLVDAVAVTAADPANAVRMILYGGVPPTTEGNPRPHSMPPFVQQLGSAEIAALANTIRTRWGGQGATASASDVDALHGIRLD